jgi:uncharacterized protein YacL
LSVRIYMTSRGRTGMVLGVVVTLLVGLFVASVLLYILAVVITVVALFVVTVLAMLAVEHGDRAIERLLPRYAARRAARPLHWPETVVGVLGDIVHAGRTRRP